MAHSETIPVQTLATPINTLRALIVEGSTGNVLAKNISVGFHGGGGFVGDFYYASFNDAVPASVYFYTGSYSGNVGSAFDDSLITVLGVGASGLLPSGSGGGITENINVTVTNARGGS